MYKNSVTSVECTYTHKEIYYLLPLRWLLVIGIYFASKRFQSHRMETYEEPTYYTKIVTLLITYLIMAILRQATIETHLY